MEAELSRYHHIDYRDRWHPESTRRLTLRRLRSLIWLWPAIDGPVMLATHGRTVVTRLEVLVDEARMAFLRFTGVKQPSMHPDRKPETRAVTTPQRARRLADARRRADERRAALNPT